MILAQELIASKGRISGGLNFPGDFLPLCRLQYQEGVPEKWLVTAISTTLRHCYNVALHCYIPENPSHCTVHFYTSRAEGLQVQGAGVTLYTCLTTDSTSRQCSLLFVAYFWQVESTGALCLQRR